MQPGVMEHSTVPKRFTEPMKFLPVAFMLGTIAFLYIAYVTLHCIPRMQSGVPENIVDNTIRDRGHLEFITINILTAMMLICYFRAILTSPGYIPQDDKYWDYQHEEVSSFVPSFLLETKKTGDRRHCKWCSKFKPDRTHHCRVCKTCILKMDHHCPWIYNCVGHFNYKFFFLLMFYSAAACNLIAWTMSETVQKTIDVETPFMTMFLVMFAETIATFLALLVSLFSVFHIFLMLNAMTTVEFCEKTLPKNDGKATASKPGEWSRYDMGMAWNVTASLGNNPLLWLLPIGGPAGDGLRYAKPNEPGQTVPLSTYDDMEATKRMVRKANQTDRKRQYEMGCNDDYDVRMS
eukprot:TRINITY_DN109069_c0_g1_i1.p1 TRINITY_DN109069_c0_g1~~TRINITY_DN109069_c0_g1_i1.p1  ORF type:complete len:349 (+),score=61.13 TRINITY_DN109069_c0_g1_i1:101-1147(+)